MKLLIALYHPFPLWTAPDWLAPRLHKEFPSVQITQLPGPKYEGIEREIADADACVAWSIRPEQFRCATQLKWIHSPAAAVHQLMFPELVNSYVMVTNAREVHGPVVAEHAVAVVLALAKKIPQAIRFQQQHIWAQRRLFEEAPPLTEAADAEVLLIGYGSIGREFTKRAKALGMRVTAIREHPERGAEEAEAVAGTADLDSLLPKADFVVLAAPITPATQHILNGARIARMKPTAYVVNVSRGPLIDDEALISALQRRAVAGAALDVFAEEPLPAGSPYWDLPNVLITPHTAAVTPKLWDRHYKQISENLRRFLAGQPLLGVVDKQVGY
jgi:phosphoglycerate dehydrogenase-like enzyme